MLFRSLDIDGSLAEVAYAMDTLKADGVCLMTNIGDRWIGDRHYWPFFEELNRRRVTVYTHPVAPCCTAGIYEEIKDSVIEFSTDTTRTIASMLFSGTAMRFPEVKMIFSHAGGTMPFILERFTRVADLPHHKEKFPRGALYELKKFYYEIAQASHPYAMASLRSFKIGRAHV